MKARNRPMRAFTVSMWWLRGGLLRAPSAVARGVGGCARPSRSARSPRGRPCGAPHRAPSPAAGRPRSPPGPRPRWRQTPGDRRDPLPREASSRGSASRPEAPSTRRLAVGRPATRGAVARGGLRGGLRYRADAGPARARPCGFRVDALRRLPRCRRGHSGASEGIVGFGRQSANDRQRRNRSAVPLLWLMI